jgi:hypothetical protein
MLTPTTTLHIATNMTVVLRIADTSLKVKIRAGEDDPDNLRARGRRIQASVTNAHKPDTENRIRG